MPLVPNSPKIYILPNLFTAGNLLFGFFAILFIFQQVPIDPDSRWAKVIESEADHFWAAIICILVAGFLDLLDGRVARIRGQESPFGREFDSLADVVSFGIAPALLLMKLVLGSFALVGLLIACLYLVCGAMRLARFNVIASDDEGGEESAEFIGLPIPAAAVVISSLTMFIIWLNGKDLELGGWRYVMPPLVVLTSLLMISGVRYPSFKNINIRTKRSIPWLIIFLVILLVTIALYEIMPAIISTSYLLYGLVRPWVSKRLRREIEEGPEDGEDLEPLDEDLENDEKPPASADS
ncbi:MAG: CDP-diacylglycerol--serine O-phosphatidyltransferase [Verrucomicrobiales bacterium]|jgi:CDP-diacylglycerol--serine O-phosphatidyltransferase